MDFFIVAWLGFVILLVVAVIGRLYTIYQQTRMLEKFEEDVLERGYDG